MSKIDTFLQTFLAPEETFNYIYSKMNRLPQKFFVEGADYLRFEKKGDIDPDTKEEHTHSTVVIVSAPHKDVRIEDLSGGAFDVDLAVYVRVI